MATSTQYNPNQAMNRQLLAAGASKTVYALIVPETEQAKRHALGYDAVEAQAAFFNQFRAAWTGKQDAYHREFFDEWHAWSASVVDLNRDLFPFTYPTAGASEPLRQIIFDCKARGGRAIHVFKGEYEGYKAQAEAAGLKVIEHDRDWMTPFGGCLNRVASKIRDKDLFFISQPSAIDGNVWGDFNEFVAKMPKNSVVADVTYVGAIPHSAIQRTIAAESKPWWKIFTPAPVDQVVDDRFDLNAESIRNIVFSLSKPFGAYYDRIGGVFCREQDLGLFGNMWFKSLTAIHIGRQLMRENTVFDIPEKYQSVQRNACHAAMLELGFSLTPSDVYILATTDQRPDDPLIDYLTRGGVARICLTPGMATQLGTAGDIE